MMPAAGSVRGGSGLTDEPQPKSGAQFRREVGADPGKWAREFLAAYAQADGVRTDADRLAFVTQWMRDAMDAAARVARRERDDLQKVGIWKPGDSRSMDGDDDMSAADTPSGRPR